MAKHPPFDAVPALSNGVWVREKAWVQMLQNKTRISSLRDSVHLYFLFFLLIFFLFFTKTPLPVNRQNRKLRSSLL